MMNTVRDVFNRLTKWFTGRIPGTQNILAVYAVIVTMIYSWTLITSFYKLPSWLFYLTVGQILSMYAYFFLANLLESLIVLAGVLLLDFTIFAPLKNRQEFQARSIVVVLIVLSSSMARLLLFKSFEASETFIDGELTWWLLTVVIGLFLAVVLPWNKMIRGFLEGLAERFSIFVYLYIPLSLISIVVVIVRNLN